jgi:hypothetical protein
MTRIHGTPSIEVTIGRQTRLYRTAQACARQVRASQVCAARVGAGQVRVPQVCEAQIRGG